MHHRAVRNALFLSLVVWSQTAHLAAQAQPAAAVPPAPPPKKPARAPAKYDARSDRLQGLSRDDLGRLEAQLREGPVALVEFADDAADQLPAINIASIVHAAPEAVIALVEKPEGYPKFMHTLDEVEIVRREPTRVLYDWRWRMSVLSLSGRNAMTVYPPPPERRDQGYRVTIDSQSGDLGTGRMSIRVLPHGEHESILCISLRIDLRNANYVARQLAAAARSVNRSANVSLTCAMVLSFRREAERRASYVADAPATKDLHQPLVDPGALMPLLQRGDLVFLGMSGDRLDQIAVFGLIFETRELVRQTMLDADALGASLLPGSAAKVIARDGTLTTFEWNIDLPLIGVSGRMQLRDADPLIGVDAIEGALAGGRWNFETRALANKVTLLASWASFDVRKSTWLVRSLAEADPYLGHGISAASEIMLERALRTQTIERSEQLAAKARKQQTKPKAD